MGTNWYQIGNKTCYISKVIKFYIEKEHLKSLSKRLETVILYFTDKNIMQRKDPMELNFEFLEIKNDIGQVKLKELMKKIELFF